MKKQENMGGFVYSTNKNFKIEEENEDEITPEPGKQNLKILLDKKQRAGKEVTLICGFLGAEDDLESLGKMLKNKCGSGGSVKNGEILIQGDHRKKIEIILKQSGYRVKMI